uniref:Terpene synthase 4 n=1 Tax=Origanum majorana TaxID=268884 RepID=A0A3G6V9T7_ORIMA|nr:terpene synthase 4 [Origanum majorana]
MSLAFSHVSTFFSGQRVVGSRREIIPVNGVPTTANKPSFAVKCNLTTKDLMVKMKEKLKGQDGNLTVGVADMPSSLCVIDTLERLGVDRYFRSEIHVILHDTYRLWQQKDKDICSNVTTHAMAFRLLRVNGYEVSSEELAPYANLEHFSQQKVDTAMAIELYRAAQERIHEDESGLDKILAWTTTFLEQQLLTNSILDNKLHKLVEYYLNNYHGQTNRVGARRHLDLYEMSHYQNLKPSHSLCNEDLLAFAKQGFRDFQIQQQKEFEQLQRWYEDCRLDKLSYGRDVVKISSFMASILMDDPELADVRLSIAKQMVLVTRIDDFFDHGGSREDSYKIIELVKEWKEKAEYDSEEVKILFTAVYTTVNELAEACVQQGRNSTTVKEFLVQLWIEILSAFKVELDTWSDGTEVSLDEYLSWSWISNGCRVSIVTTMHLLPTKLCSDEMLRSEECKDLCRHVSMVGRLLNDIHSFEKEHEENTGNSVSILVAGEDTEEEAIGKIKEIVEYERRKLMQIVYKRGTILPRECKDIFLKACRATFYVYSSTDEFTSPRQVMEDMKTLSS